MRWWRYSSYKNTYEGVEAVIDKDFASEKLATLIEADTLMILTNVENVFINFNEPNQQQIDDIDVATLKNTRNKVSLRKDRCCQK